MLGQSPAPTVLGVRGVPDPHPSELPVAFDSSQSSAPGRPCPRPHPARTPHPPLQSWNMSAQGGECSAGFCVLCSPPGRPSPLRPPAEFLLSYCKSHHHLQEASSPAPRQWVMTLRSLPGALLEPPLQSTSYWSRNGVFLMTPELTMLKLGNLLCLPQTVLVCLFVCC